MSAKFLGKTATLAKFRLYQAGQFATHVKGSFAYIASGPRGSGKTTLCRDIACVLTHTTDDPSPDLQKAQRLGLVDYRNGQSVSVDVVRYWRQTVHYRPMFVSAPRRRVFWIDECDGMSDAALNEWRTFIDTLPDGNDVLLSTNRKLADLQPQLQSRAMQDKFEPVPAAEIKAHLIGMGVPDDAAGDIAKECQGDVRAALNDAKSALSYIEMLKGEALATA